MNAFAKSLPGFHLPHLALLICTGLTLTAVHAEAAAPHNPCAGIASDPDRLKCYDDYFAAGGPGASDSAHAATAAAAAAPKEEFGLTKAQVNAQRQTPVDENVVTSVTSRAAKLQRPTTGQMIVTLENGQTWMQTDTGPSLGFRVGDEMTIRAAALGSFMLSAPGHGSIRVRRIR